MTTEKNDKNPREMTPEELRSEYRNKFVRTHEERNAQMLEILNRKLEETTVVLTMRELVEEYLPHLLVDNKDEQEYYAKMLSKRVGSSSRPFYIVDERTGNRIFYMRGVSPKLNTNFFDEGDLTDLDDVISYNANIITRDVRVQKIPALREKAMRDVLDQAEYTMEADISEQIHYLGWYEILDFLGIIPYDEAIEYQDTHDKREALNIYINWIDTMKLDEYVARYGRPKYDILAPHYELTKPPVKENNGASVEDVADDIDDWV